MKNKHHKDDDDEVEFDRLNSINTKYENPENEDPNSGDNNSLPRYSKWNVNKKVYYNEETNSLCDQSGLVIVEKSPKGRYGRFEEEIGKGSFKRIYKAYDYDEGKEVAWNVISTLDKGEDELNHVYDEINLLKMIKNEYIMKYLTGWFNSEKNEVILISELFTGGSLLQ